MLNVALTTHTLNPVDVIVGAAATCYKSTPRSEILDHIITAGHWTPLEFVSFNFCITGVSRSLTHQLVRKRVGVSYTQESQRYVTQDVFDYVVPQTLSAHQKLMFIDAVEDMYLVYKKLIAAGIQKEDARYILPNACCSKINMSINYRALLDLCKERMCTKAQWEIRNLMQYIKIEVERVSPVLAEYMQPKCYWLRRCSEKKSCGRCREESK